VQTRAKQCLARDGSIKEREYLALGNIKAL
jgi:hypothetical protein